MSGDVQAEFERLFGTTSPAKSPATESKPVAKKIKKNIPPQAKQIPTQIKKDIPSKPKETANKRSTVTFSSDEDSDSDDSGASEKEYAPNLNRPPPKPKPVPTAPVQRIPIQKPVKPISTSQPIPKSLLPLKRKLESALLHQPSAKASKLMHTMQNSNGDQFYVGETCLGKYAADNLFYECTVRQVQSTGRDVVVTWFNNNPKHTLIHCGDLQKVETKNFYVGEKIWARYKPDGKFYEATIESKEKNFITVVWFNNNPQHRQIASGGYTKMSELDREERFEDPRIRAQRERQEALDLQADINTDIGQIMRRNYGVMMS